MICNDTLKVVCQIVSYDVFRALKKQDKKLLWMVRGHFANDPRALPKVISAAPTNRNVRFDGDVIAMAQSWAVPSPTQALELLYIKFSDLRLSITAYIMVSVIPCTEIGIRQMAVDWISPIDDDELVDYLFALVESLKVDTYTQSPMATFLLERALTNARYCSI